MGIQKKYHAEHYLIKDNGVFPNNKNLPVILYKSVFDLPFFRPGHFIKKTFASHNWTNSWKNSMYDYHHYHSVTHEVLGVYKGETQVQLGGENGIRLLLEEGDVLIIPAGVAHKNLTPQKRFKCVGAYPSGKQYDMNYGRPEERPRTDTNIANVTLPDQDPVYGTQGELKKYWKH
ncbi:MAG TPA: cupin domain-containing protein [Flavobacteriales bacterium]|nr:cupin domain-containing protein [Flavobacteriales bacterium]